MPVLALSDAVEKQFAENSALQELIERGGVTRESDGLLALTPGMLECLIPDELREIRSKITVDVTEVSNDKISIVMRDTDIFVAVEFQLQENIFGESIVYICGYNTADSIIGKGITKAFYARLENFLQSLGILYYYGGGRASNVTYFTNVLGRVRTKDASPEEIIRATSTSAEISLEYFTHKRLQG